MQYQYSESIPFLKLDWCVSSTEVANQALGLKVRTPKNDNCKRLKASKLDVNEECSQEGWRWPGRYLRLTQRMIARCNGVAFPHRCLQPEKKLHSKKNQECIKYNNNIINIMPSCAPSRPLVSNGQCPRCENQECVRV